MNEKNDEFRMVVPLACEGNCSEKMEVKTLDWGDGEIDFCISFSADTFYAGQSVIGILKERIKFAWLSLRRGNYIHNEIITNAKAMSEFNGKLSEMLERYYERKAVLEDIERIRKAIQTKSEVAP